MTTGSTTLTVVNQALGQAVAKTTVTGSLPTFDGSPAGIAAGLFYPQVVNLVLREQDWEFARVDTALGGSTPPAVTPAPWAFWYAYPSDCVRIRQILPATWDNNDPQPIRWSEQYVSTPSPSRYIFCTVVSAQIVYTTSNAGVGQEALWDSVFEEAVIRLLASVLSLQLAGRPDLAREKLTESGQLVGVGAGLDS